ncbi:hypothetical protein TNCT_542941 [Trichonephila clavata]|uniref:Uncharacterized protein n=1 Tax=Trichonephila clavata TaxID=2740835 RepID=A0A8X6HLQ3_TRICU|nr:hypothetical protein TNCT_542941 [Trichonephila clavata]
MSKINHIELHFHSFIPSNKRAFEFRISFRAAERSVEVQIILDKISQMALSETEQFYPGVVLSLSINCPLSLGQHMGVGCKHISPGLERRVDRMRASN